MTTPDAALAAALATRLTGQPPSSVRRFTTGARHFVYEALFDHRVPIVIRIGDANAHPEMAGAVRLSRLLRPLGVLLPELLAADPEAELPWLALERLPGTDLGTVIRSLTATQLDAIAAGVARAQAITATTPTAGLHGYAVRPEAAPHTSWVGVLRDNLSRSRQRMKLFNPALVDQVEALLAANHGALDAIPATPFLHDTTVRNVIIAPDGTLSGIVDVDDLCFGDPRYPAALTLAVLLAHGGPASYVVDWLRHAGQPDDWLFRLYVALFLLDLMSEHGNAFNGNEAASTQGDRNALQRAFATTLATLHNA